MIPRAIETRYKGYRFRSRTEARWAVFFDALGVAWEYEPQGYVGAAGTCYLPDFLVDHSLIVEVKPAVNPHSEEWIGDMRRSLAKWEDFLATAPDRTPILVVHGTPGAREGVHVGGYLYRRHRELENVVFAECRKCGALSFLTFDLEGDETGYALRCQPSCASERWPIISDRIRDAMNAARGSRFEHGERGGR